MTEVKRWSTTAAGNTMAVPDGAPEGWAPSSVNNVFREAMAGVRRWQRDLHGELTATFAAQTYSLGSEEPLTANELAGIYSFVADAANTGTALLSVNSLTAAPIKFKGRHLRATEIASKQLVTVAYNKSGSEFQMVGPPAVPFDFRDSSFFATISANDDTNTANDWNVVRFDQESWDYPGKFNLASFKWQPTYAEADQKFLLMASAQIEAPGGGSLTDGDSVRIRLTKDTVATVGQCFQKMGGAAAAVIQCFGIVTAGAANDFQVEVLSTQTNFRIVASAANTWFTGWRLF